MQVTRSTLFETPTLKISTFEAKPDSEVCGDVERPSESLMVLPVEGIFSKHTSPTNHVLGTPSQCVLFAADQPYRLGFPGGIGDRALILRFDGSLAQDILSIHGNDVADYSHGLIAPEAMLLRNRLWVSYRDGNTDELEGQILGLELLSMSMSTMRPESTPGRSAALARRRRALARVKEAIATGPAYNWDVASLAQIANMSPFHLCHIFREMAGTSIYDYVLRERLAATLPAILDNCDLTTVALDAGFSSHSHFTSRFRRFFGCTPSEFRENSGNDRHIPIFARS